MLHFIYFFSTNVSIEYFKHAAHSPFFSSKCRLFHNAAFFVSCIIHVLHTGALKFKCETPVPKGYSIFQKYVKNFQVFFFNLTRMMGTLRECQ